MNRYIDKTSTKHFHMYYYLSILRSVHFLSSVLWVGSAFFLVLFVTRYKPFGQ